MVQTGQKVKLLNLTNHSSALKTSDENKLSLYQEGEISKEKFLEFKYAAKQLFKLPDIFFVVIETAVKRDRWSEEKFIDAVQHFFEMKHYGMPQPADFLEYDKTIPIYTWEESIKIGQSNCVAVDVGLSRPRWVLKEHQEKFKLKLWKSKSK